MSLTCAGKGEGRLKRLQQRRERAGLGLVSGAGTARRCCINSWLGSLRQARCTRPRSPRTWHDSMPQSLLKFVDTPTRTWGAQSWWSPRIICLRGRSKVARAGAAARAWVGPRMLPLCSGLVQAGNGLPACTRPPSVWWTGLGRIWFGISPLSHGCSLDVGQELGVLPGVGSDHRRHLTLQRVPHLEGQRPWHRVGRPAVR